jgi:hypothetical protein
LRDTPLGNGRRSGDLHESEWKTRIDSSLEPEIERRIMQR